MLQSDLEAAIAGLILDKAAKNISMARKLSPAKNREQTASASAFHSQEPENDGQSGGKVKAGQNPKPVPSHERVHRRKPHAKAGKKPKTKKTVMARQKKKKGPPKKGKKGGPGY